MLNFGQKVEEKSGDVIPKNALLWVVLAIREVKHSRETNGRYLDIELTVADNQPFARRKIWTKIADPFDNNNSEEWRTMAYGAIRRILEAVKGAVPENANSYILNQLHDLHGLVVPVITTIEKGNDQYPDDKNGVDFLSPHSSVKKITECFRLLGQGIHEYNKDKKQAAAPAQGSMFTGTHTPPPVAAPMVAANTAPAVPQAGGAAPAWLAPGATGGPVNAGLHPVAPQAPGAPQAGFSSGVNQPQPQTAGYAQPVAPQAPAPAYTAQPTAPNAGTSPSNGWTPPQGAAPAQFNG